MTIHKLEQLIAELSPEALTLLPHYSHQELMESAPQLLNKTIAVGLVT